MRGYSSPLQRRMTDFGADSSFEKASKKLREHYGITVPPGAERRITEKHARRMREMQVLHTEIPEKGTVASLVAETDGTMVPIVTTDSGSGSDACGDKRKNRKVSWEECRLTFAHPEGSVTPIFGATMGGPEQTGDHWLDCAIRAGMNEGSAVHCLGDGAPWIADQANRVFGMYGSFLLDFYHVCEYLHAAAPECAGGETDQWLKAQQSSLKASKAPEVLKALEPHLEPASRTDDKSPVRKCFRYLGNRLDQLDYKAAIEAGLPIGSGEIESSHRHVIQERLKISGAWWKAENADHMVALRTLRANGGWQHYWGQPLQDAA
jgi:hypothetical protein